MNIGQLELLGAAMAEVLMARNMQKSSLGFLDVRLNVASLPEILSLKVSPK